MTNIRGSRRNVTMMGMISDGGKTRGALQAHNEPVGWLVKMLSGPIGTPVTDDTGLKAPHS